MEKKIIVYLEDLVEQTQYTKTTTGKASMYDYALIKFHSNNNLLEFKITKQFEKGELLINETYNDKTTKDKIVVGVIGAYDIDYEIYRVDRTNQRNSSKLG